MNASRKKMKHLLLNERIKAALVCGLLTLFLAACSGGGSGGDSGGGVNADTTAPSVPSGLSAQVVSVAQIDLAWLAANDNVGVTGYNLYRGGSLVASATGTTWQNAGLTADTEYCYTVAAIDAAGNASAQSSQVCATTQSGTAAGTDTVFPLDEGTGGLVGGGSLDWPANMSFASPLAEYNISRGFGFQTSSGTYHLGEDLPCAQYTPVYAIGDGEVVFSTFRPGTTNWGGVFVVQITEPSPFFVIYGHIDQVTLPSVGTRVTRGQQIAKIERDGTHGWITHLHFQVGTGDFSLGAGRASPPGYANSTSGWVAPYNYLSQFRTGGLPVAETCNGVDDNSDGIIDNGDCWVAIYRFVDNNTGARCWNTALTPPGTCSSYAREIEAWIAYNTPVPNTIPLVQCSKQTDHILVQKDSGDYNDLIQAGYNCGVNLGYVYVVGMGPQAQQLPFANKCDVYRFRFDVTGGGAHLFTRGADDTSGMAYEPPSRFEVLTSHECFSSPPQ